MADEAYYLDSKDREAFLRMWQEFRRRQPTRVRGVEPDTTGYQPPEAYLARTPSGGIPILDSVGTAGTADDVPSYAECDMWRVLEGAGTADGDIQIVRDLSKRVYNLSGSPVPGNKWILAVRDKFGVWYYVNTDGGFPSVTQCSRWDTGGGYPTLSAIVSYSGSTRMELANLVVDMSQDYLSKTYLVLGETSWSLQRTTDQDIIVPGDHIKLYLGIWYGRYSGSGSPPATVESEWLEKCVGEYNSTTTITGGAGQPDSLGAYLGGGSIMLTFDQLQPWDGSRYVAPTQGVWDSGQKTLVRMRIRAERLSSSGIEYNIICGQTTTAAGTILKDPDLKVLQLYKAQQVIESPGPSVSATIEDPTP
jgi:hypothetical protein